MTKEQKEGYNGFTVTGSLNKKITAIQTNNHYRKDAVSLRDNEYISWGYASPIKFIFTDYESMCKFMDENKLN